MGISNYWGLLALLAVPAIIILYMLRPRHQIREVASNYLWQTIVEKLEHARKIEKLKKNILLLLDVLIALLIAALLAGIYLNATQLSKHQIIIVDASFSMHASDVSPNRMAKAKQMAVDYIEKLPAQAPLSLIVLDKTPNLIYQQEDNKSLLINAIEQLEAGYNYCRTDDVYRQVELLDDSTDATVVYFGDKTIEGANNYQVRQNDDNIAVIKVVNKQIGQSLSSLVVLYNHGSKDLELPVSIYCDDQYITTKNITVHAHGQASNVFDNLPLNTKVVRATLDKDDILALDNVAYGVNAVQNELKIAYVSKGNIFLEKALKARGATHISKIDPADYVALSDYQIYIFEGFVPAVLPSNGGIWLIDPPDQTTLDFATKTGYIKQPDYHLSDHPVNRFIDQPTFGIAMSQVYTAQSDNQPIITTKQGDLAFSTKLNNQKTVVFGFDFRYSDLPLEIDFPVMINNIISYLQVDDMLDKTSFSSGDRVPIRRLASTAKVEVIDPSGQLWPLSSQTSPVVFDSSRTLGVYQINQYAADDNAVTTGYFVVNPPLIDTKDQASTLVNSGGVHYQTKDDLLLYLGLILLVLLLVELLIRYFKPSAKWLAKKGRTA